MARRRADRRRPPRPHRRAPGSARRRPGRPGRLQRTNKECRPTVSRRSSSSCIRNSRAPAGSGSCSSRRASTWTCRRPPLGDALPDTLQGHAGAVVFGGPMSANDSDEFVQTRNRMAQDPAPRGEPAVSRHLPRRADAGQPSRRQGRGPRRGPGRDRLVSAARHGGRPGPDALAGDGLSVSSRGVFAAKGRNLAGDGRDLPQPGVPLWRQRLGHPVPCRADAGDDAALGGARRAALRTARCAARPRPSRRPADLGHASASRWLVEFLGDGVWRKDARCELRSIHGRRGVSSS